MAPNEPVLFMFSKMASQWNYSPSGERTGLNLPALNVAMSFYDIDDKALMFERLQICESQVLTLQHLKK